MTVEYSLLHNVKIASPCPANWDHMSGDDRVRFCGECRLHVYNLSAMSIADGEKLLRESEGRLCVRLFRRKDGTVITRDCPVGRNILRRRIARACAAIAAAIAMLATSLGFARVGRKIASWHSPLYMMEDWSRHNAWEMGDACPIGPPAVPTPTMVPADPDGAPTSTCSDPEWPGAGDDGNAEPLTENDLIETPSGAADVPIRVDVASSRED